MLISGQSQEGVMGPNFNRSIIKGFVGARVSNLCF